MNSKENPWLRPLQVARQVVELAARDVVLVPASWWKEPANQYITLTPATVMPALDDHDALVDSRAWERAWSRSICSGTGNSIAAYAPGDGAWEVAEWAIETDVPLGVIRPGKSDSVRVAARLWLRHVDPAWRRAQGQHPEVSPEVILGWLDRIISVVEADPTAAVIFQPKSFLGLMVAEIEGVQTPHREVWWRGYDAYSCWW